jgi:hypothetical protein
MFIADRGSDRRALLRFVHTVTGLYPWAYAVIVFSHKTLFSLSYLRRLLHVRNKSPNQGRKPYIIHARRSYYVTCSKRKIVISTECVHFLYSRARQHRCTNVAARHVLTRAPRRNDFPSAGRRIRDILFGHVYTQYDHTHTRACIVYTYIHTRALTHIGILNRMLSHALKTTRHQLCSAEISAVHWWSNRFRYASRARVCVCVCVCACT